MNDIFKFWSDLKPSDVRIHPEDSKVLDRVGHHFELECLAGPFMGPLRTARVVLLYLSPGYDVSDKDHAMSEVGQDYYARQRTGNGKLPSEKEHQGAWKWVGKKIKQFGLSPESIASDVAFLNISPYKSKKFHDEKLLAALPSCRTALGWAQSVLFPEAVEGKRVVVCMRSHNYWGLGKEKPYGVALFAPACTPNGTMYGPMRETVKEAVQAMLR